MNLPEVGAEMKVRCLDGSVLAGKVERRNLFSGFVVLAGGKGELYTVYVEFDCDGGFRQRANTKIMKL